MLDSGLQSTLLAGVPASESVVSAQRAREILRAGGDLVALTIGEPDFATPPEVVEAARLAAERGQTRYTPVTGTIELRQAIAAKMRRDHSAGYDWASEITVGCGAKHLIFSALMATLNPGDEVIVVSPYWVSYPSIVRLAGATPVFVTTRPEDGYRLAAAALRAAISPRTRWLILNSPNNPTGAVLSRDDLRTLAEVLRDFPQVLVMSDEIYQHIVFSGYEPASMAEFPVLRDRVLIINGVSKAYAMTGWRIGYAVGPAPLIAAIGKIQSHSTGGASSVSQAAAAAALQLPASLLKERAAIYERRRDAALEVLARSQRLRVFQPAGAFYIFAEVPERWDERDRLDAHLLRHGVAVVAGEAFGVNNAFRLSIATGESALVEGCWRIVRALER